MVWGKFEGGIFMCSDVSGTMRAWDIALPRGSGGASHEGGNAEHLRGVLESSAVAVVPGARDLIWMPDNVPHESLPPPAAELKPGRMRQFFSLVTSEVGVWWAQHSTENRLGVTPPPNVRILHHSKFGDDV